MLEYTTALGVKQRKISVNVKNNDIGSMMSILK